MNVSVFRKFQTWKSGIVSLAIAVFVSALLLISTAPASAAVNFSSGRDCDSNAVINCGALSTSELISKYNGNTSTATIFSWFGITNADVQNMGTTAVAGAVTKGGNVTVNGKIVAYGALTAGRQNIAGSTRVVQNGVTFYTRPPSVSFRSSSLASYVVLNKDGQFLFAIIAACGNPVKATNAVPNPKPPEVKPPEVKPPEVIPPQPEVPPVTPVVPEVKPPVTPPAQPAAQPIAAPAPVPQQLIVTGPASLAAPFVGTSIIGTAGHWFYTRRKKL